MRTAILQLALCCAAVTLASAACPSADWKAYGGKCYYRSTFSIGGLSVDDVCGFGFPGARAASVHDLETNTFLSQDLMQGSSAWLGLQSAAGASGFSWLDGSPLDWTYWYHEPTGTDQRCGSINYNHATGQWGSLDCGSQDPFLCQIDDSEAASSVPQSRL